MRNLQEQVKKAFWYQKLFWPFTVWINCSSDLKNFANSRPSASNFKSFSRSLEQFFLTVGQNNFGNKIPLLTFGRRCGCHFMSSYSTSTMQRFWIWLSGRGWWPRIFKIFEITRTIYSNSERSEQFLVTECFFNLFLEVSDI